MSGPTNLADRPSVQVGYNSTGCRLQRVCRYRQFPAGYVRYETIEKLEHKQLTVDRLRDMDHKEIGVVGWVGDWN